MDWSDLPPLSSLRAFEAAARHLSFSAAGREMNVTHAAVSQQVRRLEQHIGVALLRREGRGLVLTDPGAELAAGLGEGFAKLRDTVEAVVAAGRERPLRVTLTPHFAMSWLLPRMASFRAEHPDLELMLNPSAEVVDMGSGEYDLAIRYGGGTWPGLEAEPLVPSNFLVVASPALVAGKRVETPADLLQLPWLVELGTDEMNDWLARHGVTGGAKQDVTHVPGYMMAPMLRDGQGVACATRVVVEEDITAGRLQVLFEDVDLGTGYHLVWRPGPMRPPLKRLVAWLKRRARMEEG